MEYRNINSTATVLQNLVNSVIEKLLPVATRNNSSFVNDIPSRLSIEGDENNLASVISGLLRSVINNARESCIRISAKELYGKIVMLSVKDSNSFNTYAMACSLQDVVPLAEQMGGDLNIINERQNITTISLKFPLESGNRLGEPLH